MCFSGKGSAKVIVLDSILKLSRISRAKWYPVILIRILYNLLRLHARKQVPQSTCMRDNFLKFASQPPTFDWHFVWNSFTGFLCSCLLNVGKCWPKNYIFYLEYKVMHMVKHNTNWELWILVRVRLLYHYDTDYDYHVHCKCNCKCMRLSVSVWVLISIWLNLMSVTISDSISMTMSIVTMMLVLTVIDSYSYRVFIKFSISASITIKYNISMIFMSMNMTYS